jgi:hypothetical protein
MALECRSVALTPHVLPLVRKIPRIFDDHRRGMLISISCDILPCSPPKLPDVKKEHVASFAGQKNKTGSSVVFPAAIPTLRDLHNGQRRLF